MSSIFLYVRIGWFILVELTSCVDMTWVARWHDVDVRQVE